MALHFDRSEFARRRQAVLARMDAEGLDGLLLFKPESHYYLTGFDTFGFAFFQCLVMTAAGAFTLLTRAPDLRQARHTSLIEDIRVWTDGADSAPITALADLVDSLGLGGRRLGVEYDTAGLTAKSGRQLDAALAGHAQPVDASTLVSRVRLIKSDAEIACVRRAAALADEALDAAHDAIGAGADEGRILADMHAAIFAAGGDYPANPFIIGSGPDALLCRYKSGRRKLEARDQITLEWAGAWRQYHAAMMRTIVVGAATDPQLRMHEVAVEAMAACRQALRPGAPIGAVFDAYARTCDGAGMAPHRLNACGYSLGAVYAPSWMDFPMFHAGNKVIAEPGMVFFLHMILMDSDAGLAMCPGHTVIVTKDGNEVLSRHDLSLFVA